MVVHNDNDDTIRGEEGLEKICKIGNRKRKSLEDENNDEKTKKTKMLEEESSEGWELSR